MAASGRATRGVHRQGATHKSRPPFSFRLLKAADRTRAQVSLNGPLPSAHAGGRHSWRMGRMAWTETVRAQMPLRDPDIQTPRKLAAYSNTGLLGSGAGFCVSATTIAAGMPWTATTAT